jgi:hypothetical protein
VRIESRHLRKDLFQHIEEDAFMYFYVHCLALEGLLAERLAEKTHVVEVSPCIIDDVKAVGTGLVPRKAHAQSVAHIHKIPAACHDGKTLAAYLLQYSPCYRIHCLLVLGLGGADTA